MFHVIAAMGDVFFFFFKQKTAYEIRPCDWSSDVCSSDLGGAYAQRQRERQETIRHDQLQFRFKSRDRRGRRRRRSEERRVGKECPVLCRSRWAPDHSQKKTASAPQSTPPTQRTC